MKNKRSMLLLLMIVIVTIGCESKESIPDGFYPYEEDEVLSAVNGTGFQPELPAFVPIEVEVQVSDQYVMQDTDIEALDISFYTLENDLLSIQFYDGEIEQELLDPETVEITDAVEGQYVDNSFAQTLWWQKQGLTYKITYRSSGKDDEHEKVSKEELITVARSFQS